MHEGAWSDILGTFGQPRRDLGLCWALLGKFGATLELSWALLGNFGVTLEFCWALLDNFGATLAVVRFGTSLDTLSMIADARFKNVDVLSKVSR